LSTTAQVFENGPSSRLDTVCAVVPFKNEAATTLACVNSLAGLGLGEVLLVDNRSSRDQATAVAAGVVGMGNVRLLRYDRPFNYQRLNNWAVAQTSRPIIWLLNNDVEVPAGQGGVARAMAERAVRPDVGAVGCVLLYGDRRTIQHAGVYLVPGGTAAHLYARLPLARVTADRRRHPYDITADLEVSAVTAASLMVTRERFDAVGGFNEAFTITGGDVDLCLRLRDAGGRCLLAGARHGVLVHHESKSRRHLPLPYEDFAESYRVYARHFDLTRGDPFIDVRRLPRA
jgi:GT2 family glycosyltransferase